MIATNVIVYFAATRWGGVPGTDKRLVCALGTEHDVLWVDPPFSFLTRRRGGGAEVNRAGISSVAPGVRLLQTRSVPGSSRLGVRVLTRLILERNLRSALTTLNLVSVGIVVGSPRERFPRGVDGARLLYVTDDWIGGAEMMRLRVTRVARDLRRNVRQADAVAAISPALRDQLSGEFGVPVEVLGNGCDPVDTDVSAPEPEPVAGLVGQLNERLDLRVLDAVRAGGTPLVIIGPRTDRSPATGVELDRVLSSEGVTWLGELLPADLPNYLATFGVGLTPYADTAFNRASFPLKILEYLANGLAVVSTDLPAVRWLDTDLIEIGTDPEDFAQRVRSVLSRPFDRDERLRRIEFARSHTWVARSRQLLAIFAAVDDRARRGGTLVDTGSR